MMASTSFRDWFKSEADARKSEMQMEQARWAQAVQKNAQYDPFQMYEKTEKFMAEKQRLRAEAQFQAEVEKCGAVSPDVLESPAYAVSLKELRMLWSAVFPGKWINPAEISEEHKRWFVRLHKNDQFESADTYSEPDMRITTVYRLRDD